MRDVPQLKLVREDQGWSQRDLAARSGVAQNTISQLERGERQAMPSTVRKLADALGVDPPALFAESTMDRFIAMGAHATSKQSPEAREELDQAARERDLSLLLPHIAVDLETARRQAERRFFGQMDEGPGGRYGDLERLREEFHKEADRVRKEWYETGRWAEFYVSGELVNRRIAFAKAHEYSEPFTEDLMAVLSSQAEEGYLRSIKLALHSYAGDHVVDPVAVRSRLFSGDPKETVLAAQLVLDKAKRIVEEHEGYLQSFRRVPDRYHVDPEAHDRILQLERALLRQREVAAEDIRKLMDLYDEGLDTLEDQIIEMRKEGDALEAFVRQA
jgi:transcriptional regulator with XRE-family HTH domain